MNLLDALKAGHGIVFDPPKPGVAVSPCTKCDCPLYWRYTTSGPLYCAQCFPADKKRVKCWKMVLTIDGAPKLVDKALADKADAHHCATGVWTLDPAILFPASRQSPRRSRCDGARMAGRSFLAPSSSRPRPINVTDLSA